MLFRLTGNTKSFNLTIINYQLIHRSNDRNIRSNYRNDLVELIQLICVPVKESCLSFKSALSDSWTILRAQLQPLLFMEVLFKHTGMDLIEPFHCGPWGTVSC